MSASADLQQAIVDLLGQEGMIRLPVPIIGRQTKRLADEIKAAVAKKSSLCVWVMPPLPTSALQGNPFVFFDKAELRVRIVEQPQTNNTGADAYDLIDDIANSLQWMPQRQIQAVVTDYMTAQNVDQTTALAALRADASYGPQFKLLDMLAHPLQLAPRPTEMVEDPETRIVDVIFEAVYGFQPPS
jgi:hypothetical protein